MITPVLFGLGVMTFAAWAFCHAVAHAERQDALSERLDAYTEASFWFAIALGFALFIIPGALASGAFEPIVTTLLVSMAGLAVATRIARRYEAGVERRRAIWAGEPYRQPLWSPMFAAVVVAAVALLTVIVSGNMVIDAVEALPADWADTTSTHDAVPPENSITAFLIWICSIPVSFGLVLGAWFIQRFRVRAENARYELHQERFNERIKQDAGDTTDAVLSNDRNANPPDVAAF